MCIFVSQTNSHHMQNVKKKQYTLYQTKISAGNRTDNVVPEAVYKLFRKTTFELARLQTLENCLFLIKHTLH